MKVSKKIFVEEELNINGATLLSVEEAEKLPDRLLKCRNFWWLRSSGKYLNFSACVTPLGMINYRGEEININFCVRPALILDNLESSNFDIGDIFIFGNKEFEIITKELAFCREDIEFHCFNEEKNNDYESSEIKEYIDNWFEEVSSKEEKDK